MKKTVCFFNTTKAWGGGEKWHFEISTFLHDKGHDVFVITSKNSELHKRLIADKKVKTLGLNIGKFSYLNPFKIRFVKRIFKEKHVDTVIINLSSDLKIAANAAHKAGVRRIIYRRGSAIPLKNTFYNRFIFSNWVTDILANSLETKRTINANNKKLFDDKKIRVIYNAVDFNKFDNCFPKEKTDKIIIGNLARLEHQKGHDLLLDIAKILKDKNLNFELRIAGEGSLRPQLEHKIKTLDLTRHVKLTGFCSDAKRFLSQIDIFVMSSLWEGFGYAMVEAMACRKPVIAFDISSNPEIINDKETGFLIEPFDINAFADKIMLLAQNHELREKMGKQAKIFGKNKFSSQIILPQIQNYILEN